MEKLLASLGLSTKLTVGISVSTAGMVELISVDKATKTVIKYANRELKYNNAIREIVNYEEFAQALEEMFRETGLNPRNCNVVLNLPNVNFAFTKLPASVLDDQVTGALVSEVEQMYLFKRHEPVISWNPVDKAKEESGQNTFVYGAIQQTVVENIKDIFEELGAKLIAIENSNASLLKGIIYSEVISEELASGDVTNIFLLSANSYSIFAMKNGELINYYEEPLAIKSFSSDEVIVAVTSILSNALATHHSSDLLIVSEINEINAAVLARRINFPKPVKSVDANLFAEKAFIATTPHILPKYAPMITFEAVGAAVYNYDEFPVKFNFLDIVEAASSPIISISIFGKDFELARKSIFGLASIVFGIIIAFFLVIDLTLFFISKNISGNTSKIEAEITKINENIEEIEENKAKSNVYFLIKKVLGDNDSIFDTFYSMGHDLPNGIYIKSFMTMGNTTKIDGITISKNDVDKFIMALKDRKQFFEIKSISDTVNALGVLNFSIISQKAPTDFLPPDLSPEDISGLEELPGEESSQMSDWLKRSSSGSPKAEVEDLGSIPDSQKVPVNNANYNYNRPAAAGEYKLPAPAVPN